ncbi:MAG: class I SAM-dependent methyltransferase [Betaproteobacteria bacterium]|nr:class I SAM-dependent methyltransferase [Betaproteobacteria bacterium]
MRCISPCRRAMLGFLGAGTLLVAALANGVARGAELSVPYVPTPLDVVDRMLEIAKVTSKDYLIDLGSGDGRIVITAAKKYGTRGFGVDLNPQRVAEANEGATEAKVTDKVAFYQRDLFETDLSPATVITMYLLPRVNLELRPKLLELKPGTRLVSHDFSMDDWKADVHIAMDAKDKYGGHGGKSDIYFWVVPAKVAGPWRWQLQVAGKPVDYHLTLAQRFQEVAGEARVGGRSAKLLNAKLRGEEISFSFTADVNGAPVKHEFNGKVENDAITGTARLTGARLQGQHDWSAQRMSAARGEAPAGPAAR